MKRGRRAAMNGALQTAAGREPVPHEECSLMPDAASAEVIVAMDGAFGCIADARATASDFLTRVQAEHGLPVSARTLDLAQLVVSELVTNSLKYAPGPVLLQLRVAGDEVEITVWDSEPTLPMPHAADAARIGRHGLEIVTAVATGFEARREPVGKRVTALLPLLDTRTDEV